MTTLHSPHLTWVKKGLIIKPFDRCSWMVSHAMVPTAEWRHDDVYRIYFSGRDEKNRSLIAYAEVDLNDPSTIIRRSEKPVLGLGALGCFDDNGVTPSWVINHQGKKYLYYIGWNKGSTVRMSLVAGLAVSQNDGESFHRVFNVPILDRTHEEPYTINTGPCVMLDEGCWKMWYVSGVEWVNPDLPRYNIKYAESADGRHWKRNGLVCIDFASKSENALARPCVIKEGEKYKMWYSYKGDHYRIGYAESSDGLQWKRMDHLAGIEPSASGWDAEMIEYAYVFIHKGKKHMFYNGNNYGKEGIGYAVEKN